MTKRLTETEYKIWVGQQLAGNIPLYNMAMAYRIQGQLGPQRFSKAFDRLVLEHEILHSVISEETGQATWFTLQGVPAGLTLELDDIDLSEDRLKFHLEKLASTPIKLTKQVYSSNLIRLADNDWLWFFNIHHIATDATSFKLLFDRMQEIYNDQQSPTTNQRLTETKRAPAYSIKKVEPYTNQITQETPASEDLLLFHDQKKQSGYRSIRLDLQLEPCLELAEKEIGSNPLMRNLQLTCMHISILGCVLHRTSGKNYISVSVPIHNRTSAKLKQTVGLLMDVANIDVQISGNDTLKKLTDSVMKQVIEAYSNSDSNTRIEKSRTSKAVVNFLAVTYDDFLGMPTHIDWVDTGFIDKEHLARLQIIYFNNQPRPEVKLDLNIDALSERRCASFLDIYHSQARQLLENPDKPIREIDFAIHYELSTSQSSRSYQERKDNTVWEEFETIVTKQGNDVALDCQGTTITYKMLHQKACVFASVLMDNDIRPGHLVGIDTTRCINTIISILGSIRLGALFVPLDGNLPSHRRSQIITQIEEWNNDSAKIIHPQSGRSINFKSDPWDAVEENSLDQSIEDRLPKPPLKHNSCYVLFTSGTTGEPKGVEITYGSLSNYLNTTKVNIVKQRHLNFALFSALHFDLTLTSLFLPLVTGGKLVIFPQDDNKGPDTSVLCAIQDPRINILKATPSHIEICDDLSLSNTHITDWIIGGEALKTSTARRLTEFAQHKVNIFNEYGPTEATIGCMLHRYDIDKDVGLDVPIGKAIQNTQIYVLDQYLQPVPPMIRGQLHIGGENLAKGYLNNNDLTQAKFIPSPFNPDERIYVSGDSAVIDDSGVIHYLGRIDQQLKLQGMRVESGEIEAEIKSIDQITSAAVCKVSFANTRSAEPMQRCERCGIPSQVPGIRFNQANICNICCDYEEHKSNVDSFFETDSQFQKIVQEIKSTSPSKNNCIALFSGGKDSTYMLYQLIENELSPLVFTLDNGYISEQAKQNIQRVVTDLQLEHVFASTPGMNEIFAESLKVFSDVCNGCFKTIYTLSTKLALERGIGSIFTGLSSGQLVDTRLGEYYKKPDFKTERIDDLIIEARKLYHRMDDAVSRCIDTSIFEDDDTFKKVTFVDYYRYHDVPLESLYSYLDSNAPWVRPSDTGRSTNCKINDAGIYIHKKELGHHNYARPYSWDVRLGHKNRAAALVELDDTIDIKEVTTMLNEVGYTSHALINANTTKDQLVAFYTADRDIDEEYFRAQLIKRLPIGIIPSRFIRVTSLPLTSSGKRNYQALEKIAYKNISKTDNKKPITQLEKAIFECWVESFGFDDFGIDSNFFYIGGDSLTAINIASKAADRGLSIAPHLMITHPTISLIAEELASNIVETDDKKSLQETNGINVNEQIQTELSADELDDLFADNNFE
jgi:amino acid adenylation domain-containing protein